MTRAASTGWIARHMPSPQQIAANRWLAPFAARLSAPSLWRLNRRSVPRGVALGLFVAPMIPFAHMLVAALLAVPVRANVAVAAAATWIINPLTIPVFYILAYRVGDLLVALDRASGGAPEAQGTGGHWLAAAAAMSGRAALGTIVLAAGMALLGYAVATIGWRLRTARRWRNRGGRG